MHTLTGPEFKRKVQDANLKMKQVYEEAGISSTTANLWVNGHHDITPTYDKLIAAYEKLKED